MNRLAALLLVSCASTIQPNSPYEKYRDIKLAAYAAWQKAGVQTTTAYTLEYLPREALYKECFMTGVDGCIHLNNSEIFIRAGISYERQLVVLMHEVGHLTKGKTSHLKCLDSPGDDIMCVSGGKNGITPTKRDVEFIIE